MCHPVITRLHNCMTPPKALIPVVGLDSTPPPLLWLWLEKELYTHTAVHSRPTHRDCYFSHRMYVLIFRASCYLTCPAVTTGTLTRLARLKPPSSRQPAKQAQKPDRRTGLLAHILLPYSTAVPPVRGGFFYFLFPAFASSVLL